MKDVYELKEPPYNGLSESNHFTRQNVKTTYYGLLFHKALENVRLFMNSKLTLNPNIQTIVRLGSSKPI